MSEYQEWLSSFDDIIDEDKAAVEALNDLNVRGVRQRAMLLPALAGAFITFRRSATRSVERVIPVREVFSGETSLARRASRLERTFVVGDGRRVSWAEATEADHLARIEYLRTYIVGLERTIAEHQDAVELIRIHGVSCLADIEEAA